MKYTFQVTVVLKKQTWRSKKYEVIWSAMHIGKVDDNDDGDEMDKSKAYAQYTAKQCNHLCIDWFGSCINRPQRKYTNSHTSFISNWWTFRISKYQTEWWAIWFSVFKICCCKISHPSIFLPFHRHILYYHSAHQFVSRVCYRKRSSGFFFVCVGFLWALMRV